MDRPPRLHRPARGRGWEVTARTQTIEWLNARIDELESALDRDRTGLAQALAKVHARVKSGWWITEGRGAYAWNDDQYREETRGVLADVLIIATMALHESGEVARATCKSAQQEDVVQVGSRCWRAEVELEKARAQLQAISAERDDAIRAYRSLRESSDAEHRQLMAISGALVDAGTVVVEPYADAVRELTRQRDEAVAHGEREPSIVVPTDTDAAVTLLAEVRGER